MSVNTSIVVEFVSGAQGVGDTVIIELDDTHPNNLNSDGDVKSNFEPEDRPVFLVHHAAHLRVVDVKCTAGVVSETGLNIIRERELNALFNTLDAMVSLRYVAGTLLTQEWYGNIGVAVIEDNQLELTGGTVPCVCDTTFNVSFDRQYMLTPPSLSLAADETFSIYIVVYMEVL